MRRFLARLTSLLALTLGAACAGGDAPSAPNNAPPKVPPPAPAPITPGILSITVTGVPAGTAADLVVTGPAGFSRAATGAAAWSDVAPGRYTIVARPIRAADGAYEASPSLIEVDVVSAAPTILTITYSPRAAVFDLSISGLPSGTAAAVIVTPPGASDTNVPQSQRLSSTVSGRWRLQAQPLQAGGFRFAPTPAALDTIVLFGDTLRVPVRYDVISGALAVAVTGLPTGVSGAVLVQGPENFSRALTATATLTDLTPGAYRVISASVTNNGVTYRPAQDTLAVTVTASLTAAPAPVAYAAQVGQFTATVTGLPANALAALTLSNASGSRAIGASLRLDSLPVGTYTLTAARVTANDSRFAPTSVTQNVIITIGGNTVAAIAYVAVPTVVDLVITGLPTGTAPAVTVTAPSGELYTPAATQRVNPALPGRWRLSASTVNSGAGLYTPTPVSRDTVLAPGDTLNLSVQYTLTTGAIAVAVTGLPGGTTAGVVITGPDSYSRAVTASNIITHLVPGTYTVTATNVSAGGTTYNAFPATQQVQVTASLTPVTAVVNYGVPTGALAITASGLPNGATPTFIATSSGVTARTLTGTGTLSELAVGTWTITTGAVASGGLTYVPSPTARTVTIVAGGTSGTSFAFSAVAGSLIVTASGLPPEGTPVFTITGGPGGPRTLNGPGTVSPLAPATYTVTTSAITVSGTTYTPTPGSAAATVTQNSVHVVAFAFSSGGGGGGGGGLNYWVPHVYLTQAIQRLDGTVALVANRDALLRVFVRATAANAARPDVRVRLFDGATLLQTTTLAAPEPSVRTVIEEGTLGSTWNLTVPAGIVRPGLRVLVELDPAQSVPDADRADNSWPLSGTPQPISVVNAPTFNVRFVPVTVGALTGNVTALNQSQFLRTTQRIFPLRDVAADVRLPFTSSATELQSTNGNNQWLTVLSELNTLRATDGAPSTTHYYGVVKVGYTSGIAGYGYVPGRTAMGWDYLPSGDGVAAHEWGHNFGRDHAPCGGASGDASYPYAGGVIGHWGWNSGTGALVPPTATDIMGYCNNTWTSDYTWSAVMQFRSITGSTVAANRRNEGLLIWGRVIDGRILLEPAFRVTAPISPTEARSTHRVQLLDRSGSALLDVPLRADRVDHVTTHDERQFAVVVPWSAALEQRLAEIRVQDIRSPLLSASRAGTPDGPEQPVATPADPVGTVTTVASDRVRVSWSNTTYTMAIVRDAASGAILGFVRQSGSTVATGGRAVTVDYSNGVRSRR